MLSKLHLKIFCAKVARKIITQLFKYAHVCFIVQWKQDMIGHDRAPYRSRRENDLRIGR